MRWRLIRTAPASGALNMAIDRVLSESFKSGKSEPVFRLYSWSPPAVSLGRFQKAGETVDVEMCRKHGIDIVRRITGGSAILHENELTYSIVCSAEILPCRGVKESYMYLTGFLIDAYRRIGLEASYACLSDPERVRKDSGFCFSESGPCDITIYGKKIGGSAQKRTRKKIFQHGSIPFTIRDDIEKFFRVPVSGSSEAVSLYKLHCPLEGFEDLILESFERKMGVEFYETSLTAGEKELAEKLIYEKEKAPLAE